jgi:methylated-DNA-[protein]-cysteine S-methyltransferase
VYYYSETASPIGKLLLVGDGDALLRIDFEGVAPAADWRRDDRILRRVREQLAAYFGRELTRFELPLGPEGSPFQQRTWAALRKIPYGRTVSYAELARTIGQPRAARAVGSANGRNPIPIIIPCHRVIAAGGRLGGYGGGLDRKRLLLDLEAGAGAALTAS